MTHPEDAPLTTFRRLYALMTWFGLLLMATILVLLVAVLFRNMPIGTARTQALETVWPTQTALAVAFGGGGTPQTGVAVVALPATCAACHAIAGTSAAGKVCPDLTHIGTVAVERLAATDYRGTATTPADYIRESILDPNAYVVQGTGWTAPDGTSAMPRAVGTVLATRELNQLVAYLASLE